MWLSASGDDVELGNALADALERATGRRLLHHGLEYRFGLSLIEKHGATLGPFTFALSGAPESPQFATDLAAATGDSTLILAGKGSADILSGARVLTEADLRLSKEEALALASGSSDYWQMAGGALETFINLALPGAARRPTPSGYWLAPGQELEVSAPELSAALLAKGRFAEALDLAVTEQPETVPNVLKAAGSYFLERGLHRRLWEALARLEPFQRAHPATLTAYLRAANRVGRLREARNETEAYLSKASAPELQALHALLYLKGGKRLEAARQAHSLEATSFTNFALARTLGSGAPEEAEALLRESLDLAEAAGDTFATLRAAWALAVQFLLSGQYLDAKYWSRWAIDLYRARDVSNARTWLLLINEWAYARILTGDVKGLRDLLGELVPNLNAANAPDANLTRTTLAELSIAQGDFAAAHTLLEHPGTDRTLWAQNALPLSRCLAELGRFDEALDVARQAYALAEAAGRCAPAAALARLLPPQEALSYAEEAFEASPREGAHLIAHTGAVLARVRSNLGNEAGAAEALRASEYAARDLGGTGFVLLERQPQSSGGPQVELRLLGTPRVTLAGKLVALSMRQLEVATLLALYPEGLIGGELKAHLFGDERPKSLKATLSRLRSLLPIASQPYRLSCYADFVKVRKFLDAGDTAAAAALYDGPLLPGSASPRITEERETLSEAFVRAALASADPEVLFAAAEAEPGRLELLESLLNVLPGNDPRFPVLATRAELLRRDFS